MPTRRSLLASAAALAAAPTQAALPPDVIEQVETYLNGIDTLSARFTQIDPDGALDTGRVYMHRPGRLRFEYDPPTELLIVATDWRLVVREGRNDSTTTIPLDRTPLGILLAERVRLSGPVTIRSIGELNDELHLSVFQTDEPGLGELELVFGLSPIALRRWRVLDAQGQITQVLLEDMAVNVRLDPALFRTSSLGARG